MNLGSAVASDHPMLAQEANSYLHPEPVRVVHQLYISYGRRVEHASITSGDFIYVFLKRRKLNQDQQGKIQIQIIPDQR